MVELMLVITIMGIMVGMITPNLRSALEGRALAHAAQGLSTTIRYARSVAVERGLVTKLSFDLNSGKVIFQVESDPLNNAGVFTEEPLPIAFKTGEDRKVKVSSIIKRSLSGSQQNNEITFNPNGSTSDTFIYLTKEDGTNVHTIGIVGLVGQVIVWEKSVESFYE